MTGLTRHAFPADSFTLAALRSHLVSVSGAR